MQVPVQRMYSDPTTLANSLQACQRLFRHDGVVLLYDTTLEAEACGCPLAWPEGRAPTIASPLAGSGADLATLDPSFHGTRPGSMLANPEHGVVASGGMPRMYAYGPGRADTPEQMVANGRRIDFRQHDLYDAAADPLMLREKAKRLAEADAANSKYPP